MLSLLRRWVRQKFGAGLPTIRRPRGRSRFLVGRFKDPAVKAGLRPGRHRELKYRLFLPTGSSDRDGLPLIVMLHGCRQDSLAFAAGTRMNTLAEEGRCAVLYPEQSEQYNPLRCWNWFEPASLAGQGEAASIARLIEQVAMRRPIDPRRVCAVGMSAGGAMFAHASARRDAVRPIGHVHRRGTTDRVQGGGIRRDRADARDSRRLRHDGQSRERGSNDRAAEGAC
jgi:hypothetical protein